MFKIFNKTPEIPAKTTRNPSALDFPCSFGLLFLLLVSTTSSGFGGKSPEEYQATPYRYVQLSRVTVPPFYLPSGRRVDMNSDLGAIIETEINQSEYFRSGGSDSRLVISGGVTSMEMDVTQLNIRFGWNPNGALPIFPGRIVEGEFDLRLSTLSMDFKIFDKYTGETYVASYTNENISELNFKVKVNLLNLQSTLDLLTKTKLTEAIRKATRDVLENISEHPNFHYIPWNAHVLHVNEAKDSLFFNAGVLQGVKEGDIFSAYSSCSDNREEFCFERFLSDIRVISVSGRQSEAEPYTEQDFLSIVEPGDKIYIKVLD